MSPEQARGKAVDRRADIWAFGVVVYEMLTGARMFSCGDVTDVLAAVLRQDIDWNALPSNTPRRLRVLLERCLDRDVKQRLRDIGEARVEIAKIESGVPDSVMAAAADTRAQRSLMVRVLPWAVAAAALATTGALGWSRVSPTAPMPVYASIDAPETFVLGEDSPIAALPTRTPMVFTADGGALVIQLARANRPQLFIRPLDKPDARPIAGTDDAHVPFVSPDGKWIGFWAANELRKVPIEGGTAVTICPLPSGTLGPAGATWSVDDTIVFGDQTSNRLMRVSANGGTPVAVSATLPFGRQQVAPHFLPDGKRVLFTDASKTDVSDTRLMVQPLDGGEPRLVLASASDGRVLSSGQLVFMRLGALMTIGFDATRVEVRGDAVVALSRVMQSGLRGIADAQNVGAGMFAVSRLGTLAFIPGPVTGPDENRLVWLAANHESASAEPTSGAPMGARIYTRVSPDGSRAIVTLQTPLRWEKWLADWKRGVWTACRDCGDGVGPPVWSTDGRWVLFGRNDTLVKHALDNSSPDQVLIRETDRLLGPTTWLADGRIVYVSSPDGRTFEIKALEHGAGAGRVVVPLGLGTEPEASADGRWLAYVSLQGAQAEVVIQAFPGPGPRVEVSAGGGSNPMWSSNGRSLYYLSRDRAAPSVMVVDVSTVGAVSVGRPSQLFRLPSQQNCVFTRCYDLSADGQRFLFRDRPVATRQSVTRIDLVTNWTATLGKGR